MNHRNLAVLILGLLALVGCAEKRVITQNSTQDVTSTETMKTVWLHIDGFKKSKSGAT